jgi:hypothetical protein
MDKANEIINSAIGVDNNIGLEYQKQLMELAAMYSEYGNVPNKNRVKTLTNKQQKSRAKAKAAKKSRKLNRK